MNDSNANTPIAREPTTSRHLQRNISEKLQKSLQLLDSAVISSSSLLRTSKSLRVGKSYAPQYVQHSPFNVSLFGASHLGASFDENLVQESTGLSNTSFTLPSIGETFFKDSNVSIADASLAAVNLLDDPDPGSSATRILFEGFLDVLQTYPSETQVFTLLESYGQLCQDNVVKLKSLASRLPVSQNKFSRTLHMKHFLQHEANTWELIRILYEDRLHSEITDQEMAALDVKEQKISCKQFVDRLYERDASLRQNQLVVNWLECIAAREMEDNGYTKFEYFTDKCISWENTLNTLKQSNRPNQSTLERSYVSELDPDASVRQSKPLTDLDKEDEAKFLHSLFVYIRSGRLSQAERLCEHCGQYWRVATLQGWRLHHDPNFGGLQPGGNPKPIEGNAARDIWKAACWTMSQQEVFHPYERAVYAALCGNLNALLPICSSWEECLWAYFRVMIDLKVEMEIRSIMTPSRGFQELPREYWDQSRLMPETIFQELRASSVESIQKESKEPFHVIQKYIILDDIEGLIEEMYDLAQTKFMYTNHLARFLAHLVLFLRVIGRCSKEELCSAILERYVKLLIEEREIRLIPAYTSHLPQIQQVSCYASFLEGISEREERQLCLKLAEEAGLDIPQITKTVVETIHAKPDSLPAEAALSDLQSQTTPEDLEKISAIEWLIFDPSQRSEALRQANSLMRIFLALHKLDAAQAVFTKIPPDSIDVIMKQWKAQTGSSELSATDENATREYLCIQTYLQAQDAFHDWFEHFHNGKPDSLQLPRGASFSERIAYEHKEKQYEADLDRWKHTLDLQTKTTVGKMYNVLLFIDGGWMADQRQEDPVNEARQLQMRRLREMCLPQIAYLLHSLLQSTVQHRECLLLLDVIASEQHQLYKVFQKQELQRFLGKLRESSIALLDCNLDPLGCRIK